MDSASPLFERHVVAEDADRGPFHERVAESRSVDFVAGEPSENGGFGPAAFLGSSIQKLGGNDVDIT